MWSHIIGLTATYNDFDYTGAVFRVEESLSTKKGLDKRAVGYGQAFPFLANLPAGYVRRGGHILLTTPVWRSMVGFDLAQSLASYHWNHFFTVSLIGQGYFHSKLEQRLAMAFEPRGQQWLLYGHRSKIA